LLEERKPRTRFDATARNVDWRAGADYYNNDVANLARSIIPAGSSILEVGCSSGTLLAKLQPSRGMGVDISEQAIRIAREKYPHLKFVVGDAEVLPFDAKFDYVIMSNLVGRLRDVYRAFLNLNKVTTPQTRVLVTVPNKTWRPVLKLAEKLKLRMPERIENRLTLGDVENLLYLTGYETIKRGRRLVLPKCVPVISALLNQYVARSPLSRSLCLIEYVVARETPKGLQPQRDYTCSIIIPTKNEAGNIEEAVTRTPDLGKHTELVFVDGNSTDGTVEKIHEIIAKYSNHDIKFLSQGDGIGKRDAVWKGFDIATGDILFILDSDLTVAPEDLSKFYDCIVKRRGEFINGCRFVYPMEDKAMRTLNLLANRFFSWILTWLLSQRIKDTLCGTKALFRWDYEKMKACRAHFGDFDPFGDFDLLFGAAKLGLRIANLPVRYRKRVYGDIKIRRFRHGWLLLKMCAVAAWKIKIQGSLRS